MTAGHTLSLIRRINGENAFLDTTKGVAVGIIAGFDFQMNELVMESGDELVMYTDGITEAMNEQHELFTEKRILVEINSFKEQPIMDTACRLREVAREHAGAEPQSDDIAVMVLKYN